MHFVLVQLQMDVVSVGRLVEAARDDALFQLLRGYGRRSRLLEAACLNFRAVLKEYDATLTSGDQTELLREMVAEMASHRRMLYFQLALQLVCNSCSSDIPSNSC
jgi:hypothetical protein